MDDAPKKATGSGLNLEEGSRSGGGTLGAVLATCAIFILIFAAGYVWHLKTLKLASERDYQVRPGYFTPEMIADLFTTLESEDEFIFPDKLFRESDSRFLGKELSSEKDVLQIYRAIKDYRTPQPVSVQDKLEKLYYLYMNRAENAGRSGNYARSLYYYRKAEGIKPGSREVQENLQLLTRMMAAIRLREDEAVRIRAYDRIKRFVETKVDFLKYLYSRELNLSPDLKGDISIEVFIKKNGNVAQANVIESSLRSPKFEQSLANHVRIWNFGEVDQQAKDACVLLRLYFKKKNVITVYVGELCRE